LTELVAHDASDATNIESSIRSRLDSAITLLFYSDEYMSKPEDTQAGIGKQIEMWNCLVTKTPEPYNHGFDQIISSISIPASESCLQTENSTFCGWADNAFSSTCKSRE
jgi:hypothetical protein